jgi:hypothetical protein
MRPGTTIRRWATRGGFTAVAAIALLAGQQAAISRAQAAGAGSPAVTNPYSPAYHHAYRHGVVPTISQLAKMRGWARSHPAAIHGTSASDLNYGGGIDAIGVTTGPEKVYLVFYGSQWGTQGTGSNGNITLTGDPSKEAPYAQQFLKGLGTGGELWSGVMTQYCDGVATGAQSCPASNTEHVAYPTGGVLAGVWVDESTASPATASGHQLGVEAVNAAAHFGNTTAASNRDAQYVILSPTGTNPDNWRTQGFCAWHDYNGDSTLSGGKVTSPYGDIAFTNLPYLTDAGLSCGQGFVNNPGTLDGVSIVEGHEYAETITDQNPPGGWIQGNSENGDKCAWITPGTAGGSFNLTTGTGTFAVQTTWANDGKSGAGTCEGSHAIVGNGNGGGVVNGGFGTGTFSGWTTSGAATAIVSSGQHSGSYAARAGLSSHTNGISNIVQTFTASGSTLTVFYDVSCPDTTTSAWATVLLKDNTTGTSYTMLGRTCTHGAGWKRAAHAVTSGHSYTLTLRNRDDNDTADGAYTLFDDVGVS